MALRIVKVGRVRNGLLRTAAVDIIGLDYDWWHSLAAADDQLEPGEEPMPMGPDGWLHYGRVGEAGQPEEPTWPDTSGHQTAEEAAAALVAKLGRAVRWQ